MKVSTTKITPNKASEWLKRNTLNRPIRMSRVEGYARAMELGQWNLNGVAIKFNCDGTLIDGQHRLLACISANTPFTSLVVEGVDAEAIRTIDVGAKRTYADLLGMRGYNNVNTLAGVVRFVAGWDNFQTLLHSGLTALLSYEDMDKTMTAHEDALVEVTSKCHNWYSNSSDTYKVPPTLAAGMMALMDRVDRETSRWFWERVYSGEMLEAGEPVYVLRKRLAQQSRTNKIARNVITAFCVKAFNATLEGREIRYIAYKPTGPHKEQFPTITGLE